MVFYHIYCHFQSLTKLSIGHRKVLKDVGFNYLAFVLCHTAG